ncbi:LADA_0A03158g1_1 [Lachancea dasiensis]|uniref:LADA_0A03158g1_1 n=1 Tax=Lachancea dasiensis TaxID=1072105 RepID=A0A1G4IMT7_9SACH|nr:LADA_0A03158g1_1 [Lachancea dasiensis]
MSNCEISDSFLESSNVLKRKKEDCQEELLEAEIKRVALDDADEESKSNQTDKLEEELEDRNVENKVTDASQTDTGTDSGDNLDKDYIHLRMLCLVKQASMIVGPGGEKISKMKSETHTRINVSDNIRGVPERVIFIRGRCEDVAKVFGMIVRAINGEKGGEPAQNSIPLTINVLVPHHMMGCVIGRQGLRLREIEELSAAKLSTGPQTLPMSNDRILSVTGVADAIHIATYYLGQTILNHRMTFAAKKCIFYSPNLLNPVLVNDYGVNLQHQQQHQYRPGENGKRRLYRMSLPSHQDFSYGYAAVSSPTTALVPPLAVQNVRVSETLTNAPMASPITPPLGLVQQEIYIDNNYVGNVIGKGGKHINSVKESTGCSILIDDPVAGSEERKIVIRGTPVGVQTAIFLINNKIETDKRNKESNEKREVTPMSA